MRISSAIVSFVVTLTFLTTSVAQKSFGQSVVENVLEEDVGEETCTECDAGLTCCNPRDWYFLGEALFLDRNRPDRVVTTYQGGGGPNFRQDTRVALSTSDVPFDYEGGVRLTLGRRIGCGRSWEVSYFGLQEWGASALVHPGGPGGIRKKPALIIPQEITGNVYSGGPVRIDAIQYESELHNVEFNLRQSTERGSWLIGFRYIHLEEDFSLLAIESTGGPTGAPDFGSPHGFYEIQTSNDLIGLQAGIDRIIRQRRNCELSFKAKGGVFLNFSDQTSLAGDLDTYRTTIFTDSGAEGENLATLVELGLYLTIHVRKNLSIRGGYDVIAMNGLALAPEQWDNGVLLAGGGSALNDAGIAIYHGPSAGIVVEW